MSKRPRVTLRAEAIANVKRFAKAIADGDAEARSLLARGVAFLAVRSAGGAWSFAPSRFAGYRNNTIQMHLDDEGNDSETGPALNRLFDPRREDPKIEAAYLAVCKQLGVTPNVFKEGSKKQRRFWLALDTSVASNNAQELTTDIEEWERRADSILKAGLTKRPKGMEKPRKVKTSGGWAVERDPLVRAWVLQRAKGTCERCAEPGPFKVGKFKFLEVHHVKRLADGGPDTPQNTAAVCPNCHRALHYAVDSKELALSLAENIARLEA